MDQIILVEAQITDGQKLIEEVVRSGFEVVAACWVKTTESEQWYLYIASPVVDAEGTAKAYRRVHSVVRSMPHPFWIDPFEVKLIGATEPMAEAVREFYRCHPARLPTWYRRPELGGVSIEAAFLYPPITATTRNEYHS
jgi:hypothetical protein